MIQVLLYGDQQASKLLSLRLVEADEQCVLGLALGLRGAVQVLLAGRGQGDEMAAAIAGVGAVVRPSSD